MNIPSSIRIKIGPNLDERVQLVVCYSTAVLALDIVETLQSDGYEQIYQDQTNEKHICAKEYVSFITSTANSLKLVVFEILVSGVIFTIKGDILGLCKGSHDFVPAFTCHNHYKREKRPTKSLKIPIMI